MARVQKDGTFRIRAAPGRNYVYFRAYDPKWSDGSGVWVEVQEGETVKVEFKIKNHSRR